MVFNPRDVCPDTGFARLSYGQPGHFWTSTPRCADWVRVGTFTEWRHSSLTHLGEAKASLLMLRLFVSRGLLRRCGWR
jgi:hypothetical protein